MSGSGNAKNVAVYSLTVLTVAVPLLLLLAPDATDETKLGFTLRISARLAFLVYVAVFVTRPLRQLVPASFTRALLRNRRYIGLIFAAVMTVHLGLISWLLLIVTDQGRTLTSLLPGIATYTFVLLMLITSFDAPARALGSQNWRRLHKAGLYWIGLVFLVTLGPDVISMPSEPVYLAIGVLMAIAVSLRIAAFINGRGQRTAAIDSAR